MKCSKYRFITQITVATLLGLSLEALSTTNAKAAQIDVPAVLIQQKDFEQKGQDPLLNGKYVSNGYTDGGYTYLNPSDTSPERESSYHLDTDEGWSNDLQTIVYDNENKEWVIYYLHTAKVINGDAGAQQNWQRVTTKDFIHFSQPTIAIKDLKGDIGDAWSSAWTGSIIVNAGNITGVPKGAQVAFFSGLSNKDNQQNIWAAWSDDNGKTFAHPLNDKKIILDHYWPWTSINRSDERDPAVFYWHNKLIMYVAEGDNIGVYQSDDGLNWSNANGNQADSKIASSTFFKGLPFEAPVECPALRSMKTAGGETKQVLFFGAKAPQAKQTTGTYYIVGHLDDKGMFTPETEAKRLDQGTDYYGANFSGNYDLEKADDSLISMGWIGNWNYTNSGIKANQEGFLPNSTRIGTYSLARKISLNDDLTITSVPLTTGLEEKSVQKSVGEIASQKPIADDYYNLLNLKKQPANSKYVLHFSTKDQSAYQGAVRLVLNQGQDNNILIFDPATGKYRLDGVSSELSGNAASYYKNGYESGMGYINDSGLKGSAEFTITVYTDKNAIEIFFENGQAATVARFCVNNVQDVQIDAQDESKKNQYEINYGQVGKDLIGFEEKPAASESGGSTSSGNNVINTETPTVNNPVTNKPETNKETDNSAKKKQAQKRVVMHNSWVYHSNGKKSFLKINAGATISTYGVKEIKGKKYYILANDKYILATNVTGKKRQLRHNAFVYNQKGQRIKRYYFKKGKKLVTFGGSVKLKHKAFYIIGKNMYVKRANF